MATIERHQAPTVGDTVKLKLFVFKGNRNNNVNEIKKVDIYKEETDGPRLIETIEDITTISEGVYSVEVFLEKNKYTFGKYLDCWTATLEEDDSQDAVITNSFNVLEPLWYVSPSPIIYDFSFNFRPNRIRKGSKRYLVIEITPNVTNKSELDTYYTLLNSYSNITVSIELDACNPCAPQESDLRLITECDEIDYYDRSCAYYLIDTEDYDCGMYNIWFTLELGGNKYISNSMKFEIF